jgi:hypothetical protein
MGHREGRDSRYVPSQHEPGKFVEVLRLAVLPDVTEHAVLNLPTRHFAPGAVEVDRRVGVPEVGRGGEPSVVVPEFLVSCEW